MEVMADYYGGGGARAVTPRHNGGSRDPFRNWENDSPPSYTELKGKLFKGWYLSSTAVSYPVGKEWMEEGRLHIASIVDDLPGFIVATRDRFPAKPPPLPSAPPPSAGSRASGSGELDILPVVHWCEECEGRISTPTTLYILLEYLLELSVPQHLLGHFSAFKDRLKDSSPRYRPHSARAPHHWVFVACHCEVSECRGNFYHTLRNFVPVLVVPWERYDDFVKACGGSHVVLRLPRDGPRTTGYTKYWIQRVASKLSLGQAWIVEDQVRGFYRSIPGHPVPTCKEGSRWCFERDVVAGRRVSFGDVVGLLEEVVRAEETSENPICAIGPTTEIGAALEAFHYDIPCGVLLLNLRAMGDLRFRPELHQLETQVLGCEAVKSGKRVLLSNAFVLLDSNWDS